MTKRVCVCYIALTAFLSVPSIPLRAQVNGAELRGSVADASLAGVPGAGVTVTETDTGVVRQVKSNGSGAFDFPNLQPGHYKVHVAAPGFNETEVLLTLRVGQVQELTAKLTVLSERTSVTVSSENSSIQLADSQLGGLVDERTIRKLPLNGRDYTQLATLEPASTRSRPRTPPTELPPAEAIEASVRS